MKNRYKTRAAFPSKAKVKGLSLEDILKQDNWSNKPTWQKHYHKFVSNDSTQFQTIIGLGRPGRQTYGNGTIGWQNSAN